MSTEPAKPPYRQSVGSLCSGYGGLDIGLALGLGHNLRHAWHVENDAAPAAILRHNYPGVPNHGDLTTLDHSALEPVDWLTAGYPCQPFSPAGKRKGASDERHLWPFVAGVIGALRPRGVLLENVVGHVSLGLDAVLWELASLGYDATWGVVRAADAGAPHRRERVFVLAADTSSDECGERSGLPGVLAGPPAASAGARPQRERDGHAAGDRGATAPDPTGEGREGCEGSPRQGRRAEPARRRGAAPDPDCDGRSLVGRLNAGERDADGCGSQDIAWGAYEPSVRRWESVLGRPAPRPTEPGRTGERLSPRFVEWLMGLPGGWVTDRGLSRQAQLKALGNGVVPQQAALAVAVLRHNWPSIEVAA